MPGNPIPSGSALARLIGGEPIDALERKREGLRSLLVECEAALDAAEQREARMARRRADRVGDVTPDNIGRGHVGGAA